MRKTILAAALVLGTSLTATASDQPSKPSGQTTTASQQGQIGIKTPFNVFIDGNWIFVVNATGPNWTAALDVIATCTPVAPTTTCGPNFASGRYVAGHYDKGTFPTGYGQAPNKGAGNFQQVSGSGWVAVQLGLPYGSYKVVASAANNTSPQTDVTIAPPPSGIAAHPGVVQVNPAASQLVPTKTPAPRRP